MLLLVLNNDFECWRAHIIPGLGRTCVKSKYLYRLLNRILITRRSGPLQCTNWSKVKMRWGIFVKTSNKQTLSYNVNIGIPSIFSQLPLTASLNKIYITIMTLSILSLHICIWTQLLLFICWFSIRSV